MTTSAIAASRRKPIAIWALRVLLGLLFLSAAVMKLTAQPPMVAEFEQIGFGQWFRVLTGLIELVGGVAILIPRVSRWGAALLLLVDVGAFVAQVSILHMDWIHTVVVGALLGLAIFVQRPTEVAA